MVTVAEYRAANAKAMPEAVLQEEVRVSCKGLGLLMYHTHRSQHSPAGFLDCVIVGQRVLYRELKREGKNPTISQQEWLDRLTAAGQDADVWRPTDWFSGRIVAELQDISTRR
jgi:hypothetical protein